MRGRSLVLTIILAVLAGGIVFGFLKSDLLDEKKKPDRKIKSVPVPEVIALERTELPVVIVANGRVLAERKVVVRPVVSGTIEEIHFEVDQEVRRDQLLFRIHNRIPAIDLAEQEAVLQSRKIEAEDAVRDLERKKRLHGDGDVSEEELEAAQLKVKTSSLSLTRQLEAVKRAKKMLTYYDVQAPWSGVVIRKHVSLGTYVRVGDPVAELLSLDRMQIEVGLTQEKMLALRAGKGSGSIRLETEDGRLEIEAVRMVLEADPVTRTWPVRFLVRNSEGNRLYPGMSLRLRIHTGTSEKGYHVPADALVTRADRTWLWTVKKGRAALVPVRVLGRNGDRIRVEGGFQEGERVIVARGGNLKDGQEIDFAPAAAER